MKKRILSILILAALIITAIPFVTFGVGAAAEEEEPTLRIGGTLVEDGQYYIDGGTPTEKPAERTENYAYFKDGVLWLHSLKLDKRVSALISVADMDITILLEGNNSLSGANGETKAISSNSDLEIVGHGKLEIYRCVTGIESTDGKLTIVDAELDIKTDYDALFAKSGISTTAAKINAKMGSDITKSAIRTSNGEIRFYASDIVVNATGYGVRCNESSNQSLFIYGGSFKATSNGSSAVICSSSFNIDGGCYEDVVASESYDGSNPVEEFNSNRPSNYRYISVTPSYKYVTVSFDANGGSGYTRSFAWDAGLKFTVEEWLENTFTAPEGYYFKGWDTKLLNQVFTEDMTVKAVWGEKTVLDYIEFDISGYEVGANAADIAITPITEGLKIVENSLKVKIPADLTNSAVTTIDADRYYHFKFEFYFENPDEIILNFDLDDRECFSMKGMFAAETTKYNAQTGIYTVYMQGDPLPEAPRTVTFDANGGSGEMASVTASGSFKIPTAEEVTFTAPKGYRFAGWKIVDQTGNEEYRELKDYYFVWGNTTFIAQWEEMPSYTVNFHKNDGSGEIETVKFIETDDWKDRLPELTREEFKLVEWIEDKDDAIETSQDGVVDVYARWIFCPNVITFKINGYEIGTDASELTLTDDKGFIPDGGKYDDGTPVYTFYADDNGEPDLSAPLSGKLEAGKSYWVIIISSGDGFTTHFGKDGVEFEIRLQGFALQGGYKELRTPIEPPATMKIMIKTVPLVAEDSEDTEKPGEETTEAPGVTETESAETAETKSPETTETEATATTETKAPEESETKAPEESETKAPDESETKAPDVTETNAPDEIETTEGDDLTTESVERETESDEDETEDKAENSDSESDKSNSSEGKTGEDEANGCASFGCGGITGGTFIVLFSSIAAAAVIFKKKNK